MLTKSSKSLKVAGLGGCVHNFFRVLSFFFLILLALVVGESRPGFGWILAILAFCWLISRWFMGFPLRAWYGWAIVLLLCAFVLQVKNYGGQGDNSLQEGSVSVREDETKNGGAETGGGGDHDLFNQITIKWYDFAKRLHRVDYATRFKAFQESRTFRNDFGSKYYGNNSLEFNSLEFMSSLYGHLINHDASKLDMLTEDLRRKAINENMSALRVAEMVTTMIQEIEYILVHDGTCEEIMESNNDFIIEYHKNKSPCMPSVFAGVQAPYEFAHNLKGDCDTRTMLAHMILTRLGISSSIWLSESYGHSVLGVAVPVGFGSSNYKVIQGVKHYAVELTSKNFQIGMLIPEQQNMKNWTVTNYQNLTP